jgi:protocatechuate 3,4-dioxygenase beta subunit
MHRRVFMVGTATSLLVPSVLARADGQCTPTEPDITGPFFRPNAPFTTNIVPAGSDGTVLRLSGVVRDGRCQPLPNATIEVWQANPEGEYDTAGAGFRGQLRTDTRGAYHLDTQIPGRYRNGPTFRPAHVHLRVHATGHPPLTTQAYFPGDPYNDADPWFSPRRVIQLAQPGCHPHGPRHGTFHVTL